jgi:hypothetical protein
MAKKKLKPTELPIPAGEGKTDERRMADCLIEGVATNAHIAQMITHKSFGMTGIRECKDALQEQVDAAKEGDLSGLEGLLAGQAHALNLIFHECTRRAVINIGEHLGAMDTYFRLALRAQNQARTTIQTLAEMKNPRPVAFVQQANIAGGHQQVVNEGYRARVREIENQPNELLEAEGNVTRMDARKAHAAG